MPVRMMGVANRVQTEFNKFAAANIVSHGELFSGKICAALDRQHPRDIFETGGTFSKIANHLYAITLQFFH